MAGSRRQVVLNYAAAVMAVPAVVVLLATRIFGQTPNTPVLIIVLAIVLVSWRGGAGPGLLTTGLIALIAFPGELAAEQVVRHLVFFATGSAISLLVGSLHRARGRAEAASRDRDRFLASLSHELRTPLTPVLASVTALLDEPGPWPEGEIRAALDLIRIGVEMETRLIDDLLDVSRAIHGKLLLSPGCVDVHALIRQTLDLCRAELGGGGLRLELDLGAPRPHVEADRGRLQQVIWNLIRNAIKFTPAGGLVTIRTRERPPGRLALEVADTGIGIDPRALGKIFDPFEQENKGERKTGGLGLGLAISRAIAEAHGAQLSASSDGRGRGSAFTLEMATIDPGPDAGCPPAEPAPRPRRPLRILLVEDDPASLRVLSRLLRQKEHAVTTADSVASALEAGLSGHFDLVVSDLGLPDGTGWDLMRQLRDGRAIRGIAMSGLGQDEDLRKSQEAGFLAHLTKPVDFPRLEATIQEMASGP
ncbi:ATP-binding protein [Tundrisphaera sp. TA3]|uniref:ATP-binding protein n=1 Tax=Tundrisphaera sp. TA3 TaxID=3435775 RepID=UPI003EBDBCAC